MLATKESCFDSRFFLPSWWVRAYEAVSLSKFSTKATEQDPIAMSEESGLFPCLTQGELSGLAVALCQMQRSYNEGKCLVQVREHIKYNSQTNRVGAFGFSRVIQLLSSIRLLRQTSHGILTSPFLVRKESWRTTAKGGEFEFELTTFGESALLGLVDAYFDILHVGQEGYSLSELMGSNEPLAVGHSVWLDLQGAEQLIFLRLLKAMQWSQNLAKLDGSFFCGLGDLFEGMEEQFTGLKSPPHEHYLRLLRRLGQKLLEHGILDDWMHGDFVAIPANVSSGILWRGVSSQIFDDGISNFRNHAADILWHRQYLKSHEQVFKLLSLESYDEALVSKLRSNLQIATEEDPVLVSSPVCLAGSRVVSLGALYSEWLLRQLPNHPLPLPEEIRSSDIVKQCYLPNADLDGLAKFAKILDDRTDIVDSLTSVPGVTLVSQVSTLDPFIRNKLEQGRIASSAIGSPNSLKPRSQAKRPDQPASSIQLKKVAASELARIRSEDLSKYSALKSDYIKSLDEKSRRIIGEVQKRLQPSVFEDHIRHSLIKFMVDHPDMWHRG